MPEIYPRAGRRSPPKLEPERFACVISRAVDLCLVTTAHTAIMEQFSRVTDSLRNFKETRLSGLKPLPEFVRTHFTPCLHRGTMFPCRDALNFPNFVPRGVSASWNTECAMDARYGCLEDHWKLTTVQPQAAVAPGVARRGELARVVQHAEFQRKLPRDRHHPRHLRSVSLRLLG